jgi:hypothetical protein
MGSLRVLNPKANTDPRNDTGEQDEAMKTHKTI